MARTSKRPFLFLHKKQGAGACDFSSALHSFSFLAQLFVRLYISGCDFEVYPAASFAADLLATEV